jgi:hypothetical protein
VDQRRKRNLLYIVFYCCINYNLIVIIKRGIFSYLRLDSSHFFAVIKCPNSVEICDSYDERKWKILSNLELFCKNEKKSWFEINSGYTFNSGWRQYSICKTGLSLDWFETGGFLTLTINI